MCSPAAPGTEKMGICNSEEIRVVGRRTDRVASDVLQFAARLVVGVVKTQGVWAWESALRALQNLCPYRSKSVFSLSLSSVQSQ